MKNTLEQLLLMNTTERSNYLKENGNSLLNEMLLHIGSTDDELRDRLNYRVFIELLSERLLTSEQLTYLTLTLKGNDYLYSSIGDIELDTIFTRSYSALWLTGLIHTDAQHHFLSTDDAKAVLESCTPYLGREKDVRGFLVEKGWANGIAHGANLASAIVAHPAFELRLAPVLLQGIKDGFWKGTVFVNDEEERLVSIIQHLITKDYPEEIFIEWVEQVFDKLQFYLMETGYTPLYFSSRTNTLHFMKTLYFSLKFSQKMPQLKSIVSLFIAKWMN